MARCLKTFPLWFWGRLPLKLNWELILFNKIREFCDGITFFELLVNTDTYKEIEEPLYNHNPKLIFKLIICNFTIFELNIYSVYE